MQTQYPAFRGILEEVGWEYSAGATLDPLDILERERKRLELQRRARAAPIEVPEAVDACIDRYLEVEFDLKNPNPRGLGRMTDQIPRLAARHRHQFRKMPGRERGLLREHVRNHLLCGYLFWNFWARPEANAHENPHLDSQTLFRAWIPLIYAPQGSELIESARESSIISEKDQGVWSSASERGVALMLRTFVIEPDELDQIILVHYFQAGLLLSLLATGAIESPTLETEPGNAATVPDRLFERDDPAVSPILVVFNGSLMAWVAIMFMDHYLNVPIL